MCLFKSKKKLIDEINTLKEALNSARAGRSDAIRDLDKAKTEITALRNIIHGQDELLAKNKKRIKTQQDIINKQKEKLNVANQQSKPIPNFTKEMNDTMEEVDNLIKTIKH